MTTYIGVSGPIGAGKTTFAQMLQKHWLTGTALDSFAAPIRIVVGGLGFSLSREAKEVVTVRVFKDFGEALHHAMDDYPGSVFSEDHARLYATLMDFLVDNGHLTSGFDDILKCSPRQFMQWMGAAGRKVRQDFWIEALLARNEGRRAVVLHDVRMPNERAVCSRLAYITRAGLSYDASQTSEAHLPSLMQAADKVIYNDGSLRDLDDFARLFTYGA